jgi:hypothetical protein
MGSERSDILPAVMKCDFFSILIECFGIFVVIILPGRRKALQLWEDAQDEFRNRDRRSYCRSLDFERVQSVLKETGRGFVSRSLYDSGIEG